MPSYKAPIQDMTFLLEDVFDFNDFTQQFSAFSEINSDLARAILEEGNKVCENVLLPLNQSGDLQGCQYNDGEVTTPAGFKQAYQEFSESGWTSVAADPEFGGQGLPKMLGTLVDEMVCSSNVSFSLYVGLTTGAYHAIKAHASEELKQQYLPNMVSGQWSGSMCLTESHAGTDLGLLRTKAEPNDDGSYKLTGTKIFITAGEHDLSENIIHLVLARIAGAPEGVKGISLFIVPKYLVNDDGSLGERNPIVCGSIEHKMGIKASATCVMNLDGAKGFLVGEANQGLRNMFTMMNTERLSIGLQGLALAEISYQNAAAYAKDRLQSRSATGVKVPEKVADPIIVHPDVRRMLLTMRAYNEGSRALAMWIANQLDVESHHPADEQRQSAANFIAFMTPVAKAFFTDYGFEACNLGLQVFGGHGYVQEWGMEQYVRDARIAQIYEGTNGIQALDLIRRKLVGSKGELLLSLTMPIAAFIDEHTRDGAMSEFITPLQQGLKVLNEVSDWIIQQAEHNPDDVCAAATDYLKLVGLVALALMWAKMANAAMGHHHHDFYNNKLHVARFYMQRLLPEIDVLAVRIQTGSGTLMVMDDAAF